MTQPSDDDANSLTALVEDALCVLHEALLADPAFATCYQGTAEQLEGLYDDLWDLVEDAPYPHANPEALADAWFQWVGAEDLSSAPEEAPPRGMPPWLVAGIMMGAPGFPKYPL